MSDAPVADDVAGSRDDATGVPEVAGDAPDDVVETADAGARPAPEPDEVLLGSVALAQRALLEVTPPETVGSVIGHVTDGEHVLSLHFAADLTGYPGWHWSVTLARVEDGAPTVLETELLPGERALLAPEWVPWSERLADYRAAQAAAAAEAAARGELEGDVADDADGPDAEDEGLVDDAEEADDDAYADDSDDAEYEEDAEDVEFADEADDTDDVFDGIDIDALDDTPDDDDGADRDRADDGPRGSVG
ncbi:MULTISPECIES: DUF3027 domain-containing protein [unclassified Agromyces]|uniref:DUF3027 domain-containing protein n=1 Tax=unclassified Agromyces TaxID=2639701 RepID=UPI003014F433